MGKNRKAERKGGGGNIDLRDGSSSSHIRGGGSSSGGGGGGGGGGKSRGGQNNNNGNNNAADTTTATSMSSSSSNNNAPSLTSLVAAVTQQHYPQQQQQQQQRGDGKNNNIIRQWLSNASNYEGLLWFLACLVLGGILGFAIGSGWTDFSGTASPWRQGLGVRIRASTVYQLMTLQQQKWESVYDDMVYSLVSLQRQAESKAYARNPSHPQVFALLREAVIREPGGYVHDDLGVLEPAPSGAARGLGMVRDSYQDCQTRCVPGVAKEKLDWKQTYVVDDTKNAKPHPAISVEPNQYRQEEVLIRVPLSFQMTRDVALETLNTLIPADVQNKNNVHALDDAALLVLLLAHERGVGRHSRWLAYIASLPHQPSCGYARSIRPHMLDAIEAIRDELGVDVEGWSAELVKAAQYADRIVESLDRDFGLYLQRPERVSSMDNLRWALCQVASRATAGDDRFGSLRLIPILDLINHDVTAGPFLELTGKERLGNGDSVDATEDDAGTFVVRSLRLGRRRPLRKGQELLVNYNVPLYTPLDWFVSLGFVPPERWEPWTKVEPVLPRVRREMVPFGDLPTAQIWKEEGPAVLQRIKETEPKS